MRDISGAVTIGNIERYISDQALAMGWKPDRRRRDAVDKRGGDRRGPAGLACADVLARAAACASRRMTAPRIGGLLTFGIPAFKLDKSLLARRRAIFTAMGISSFLNLRRRTGCAPLSQLQCEIRWHCLLVWETYRSMKAGIAHEDAPGVYDALPFW